MDVKLIAKPNNPLKVVTNQKAGNCNSGLQIMIHVAKSSMCNETVLTYD